MDFLKLVREEKDRIRKELSGRASSLSTNSISEKGDSLEPQKEISERIEVPPLGDVQIEERFQDSDAFSLEDYRLSFRDISNIFFVPNFIDKDNERRALSNLNNVDWTILKSRKSKLFGNVIKSNVKIDVDYSSCKIPTWIENFIDKLVELNLFSAARRPDNVLINKYSSTEGILHHTDGPSYFDQVAILSLGSDCLMSFRPKVRTEEIGGDIFMGDVFSVLLTSCSLLYFTGDVYSKFMHGIAAETCGKQIVNNYGICLNNSSELQSVLIFYAFSFVIRGNLSFFVFFNRLKEAIEFPLHLEK